jgi:hypothetical protein
MRQIDWTMLGAIGQLLAAAVTALGLLFVVLQIRAAGRVARADFVLRLEEGFTEPLLATYHKLLPGGPWSPDRAGPSSPAEISELENYLAYFATLQVLRTQGLLTLETIDRIFAYRFFIAVNNPHTSQMLKKNRDYWQLLYTLYRDWVKLRNNQNALVPQEQYPLGFDDGGAD